MSDHLFCDEMFSNVQTKPSLAQPGAMSSHPVASRYWIKPTSQSLPQRWIWLEATAATFPRHPWRDTIASIRPTIPDYPVLPSGNVLPPLMPPGAAPTLTSCQAPSAARGRVIAAAPGWAGPGGDHAHNAPPLHGPSAGRARGATAPPLARGHAHHMAPSPRLAPPPALPSEALGGRGGLWRRRRLGGQAWSGPCPPAAGTCPPASGRRRTTRTRRRTGRLLRCCRHRRAACV